MGNAQTGSSPRSTAHRIATAFTIVAALVLAVGLFLPYVASTGATRAYRLSHPDVYTEEVGMSNSDAVDISLVEYARAYLHAGTSDTATSRLQTTGMFYFGLIAALCAFVALTLILAIVKKPVGSLVFSLFTAGMLSLLSWDFESRSIIGGDATWGFAHTLLFVAAGAVLCGSIWAIVTRRKRAH